VQGDAVGLLSSTIRFSLKVRLNYLFRLLRLGSTIRMNLLYIKCCVFFSPELNKITIVSIRTLINFVTKFNIASSLSPSLFVTPFFLSLFHAYTHAHAHAHAQSIFNHPSHPSSLCSSPPFNNNHFTHALHMLVLSMERIN